MLSWITKMGQNFIICFFMTLEENLSIPTGTWCTNWHGVCPPWLSIRERQWQGLAWEMNLLMVVKTLWEGIGRDMMNLVIKFLTIVNMRNIGFGVWVILIPITSWVESWVWWEITLTNWVSVGMIDMGAMVCQLH